MKWLALTMLVLVAVPAQAQTERIGDWWVTETVNQMTDQEFRMAILGDRNDDPVISFVCRDGRREAYIVSDKYLGAKGDKAGAAYRVSPEQEAVRELWTVAAVGGVVSGGDKAQAFADALRGRQDEYLLVASTDYEGQMHTVERPVSPEDTREAIAWVGCFG